MYLETDPDPLKNATFLHDNISTEAHSDHKDFWIWASVGSFDTGSFSDTRSS